jgi:hypothetical protein
MCLAALAASIAAQTAPPVISTNPEAVEAAAAQPQAPVAVAAPASATDAATATAAADGSAVADVDTDSVLAAAAARPRSTAPTSAGLLKHNGEDIFLTGVNLGNVQFLPFEGNPYGYTAAEMRNILDTNFADIAATGANSVRFWLHIDGSRSPTWGNQVRACLVP